jgi:beta-glucosidase
MTFYAALSDLPPLTDYDVRNGRTYMYLKRPPTFPFGHGLSYTRFQYGELAVSPSATSADGSLRIEFDLTNSGDRSGTEVAQVYVRPPSGPKQVLRGFQRVALDAGQSKRIRLDLEVSDLAHYDAKARRNVVDPGRYEVLVGASSADIRQRAPFQVGKP